MRILKIVLGVVVLALVGFLGVGAWIYSDVPKEGPARIDAGNGVVGVQTGHSYVWVIRTVHGCALVDAGTDPNAAVLLTELKAQGLRPEDVHTILLTHGHKDHWAGAARFPNAVVRVGRDDLAMVRGERSYMPALIDKLTNEPRELPARLEGIGEGEVIALDDRKVVAIHVPGHTQGSTMYLYGDLLFSGDSLFRRGDSVGLGPTLFSEDHGRIRGSLREMVAGLGFERIADGHAGLTGDGQKKLAAFLAR
jgi:hydroxyacylglutathione hydrolase